MEVQVDTPDVQARPLRPLALRRVRFVLRRLGTVVHRAHVRLLDANGPKGGVDKVCRIELHTGGRQTTVVSAVADDWRSALDAALARAARTLKRQWQRRRHHARTTLRRPPELALVLSEEPQAG